MGNIASGAWKNYCGMSIHVETTTITLSVCSLHIRMSRQAGRQAGSVCCYRRDLLALKRGVFVLHHVSIRCRRMRCSWDFVGLLCVDDQSLVAGRFSLCWLPGNAAVAELANSSNNVEVSEAPTAVTSWQPLEAVEDSLLSGRRLLE
jgi:hypothetical protein